MAAVRTGRPFIWAHGFSGWRQSRINESPHLTDQHRLLTCDQRDHNDSSPVTDAARYDVGRMAGDMCGAHGMIDKHFVICDDAVRVPLIMH